MGNNRIQTAGFLNQYSPFTLNLEKVFFAPRPKIFLQQYRPKADVPVAPHNVGFWEQSGRCFMCESCPLLTQSGHERLRIAAVQTYP
jgi:hypothetical protein